MTLRSTQNLTEMSTWNIYTSRGIKAACALG